MKTTIAEIQNYFLDKITACDFVITKLNFSNNGWVDFETLIDALEFQFSIHPQSELYCSHQGFMRIQVPDDRLSNLLALIDSKKEAFRIEQIEKKKAELAELELA